MARQDAECPVLVPEMLQVRTLVAAEATIYGSVGLWKRWSSSAQVRQKTADDRTYASVEAIGKPEFNESCDEQQCAAGDGGRSANGRAYVQSLRMILKPPSELVGYSAGQHRRAEGSEEQPGPLRGKAKQGKFSVARPGDCQNHDSGTKQGKPDATPQSCCSFVAGVTCFGIRYDLRSGRNA